LANNLALHDVDQSYVLLKDPLVSNLIGGFLGDDLSLGGSIVVYEDPDRGYLITINYYGADGGLLQQVATSDVFYEIISANKDRMYCITYTPTLIGPTLYDVTTVYMITPDNVLSYTVNLNDIGDINRIVNDSFWLN
jgi:hypothetical protein